MGTILAYQSRKRNKKSRTLPNFKTFIRLESVFCPMLRSGQKMSSSAAGREIAYFVNKDSMLCKH
ncbi:hypothetical protein BACCAP_04118 [Pseudoflavonifractor capillosus ATCC 29799]|uniref:Uncharacterized protein n=1 Tax=Pseudoflavonifractor capillosus ATCC 29799 TaxID=411467 RepID=A6P0V2_9FIRM|nr:hypothetical protein BACCAP_04118 [Pseudoflavonifractor capillosus ATCC 29799]